MSFDPGNIANPFHGGFRGLGSLNEVRLLPGTESALPTEGDRESVTYVHEGSLVMRQGARRDEILGPGYCRRSTLERPLLAGASDASHRGGTHLFVSSMTSQRREAEPSFEHRHYPFAARRGQLRLIASQDGCAESVRMRQDVRIYSAVLDPGHHLVHELATARGVWLHVVAGRVRLIDHNLKTGDGVSLDDEVSVSFTAQEASEILLFDLA